MSASHKNASLRERISNIELKFRNFNVVGTSKKKEKQPNILGSMTSPLPRRPMPSSLQLKVAGNKPDGFQLNGAVARTQKPVWDTNFAYANHRQSDSAENEKLLKEIMLKSGVLTIRGNTHEATIDDLESVGELGHGTCGNVVKMVYKETGDVIAVKQMRRTGNKEENKRVIMDLDTVLRSHDCPYIVQFLGCFITDYEVWICMELMETCLDKLYKKLQTGIPEHILGPMAVSIVKALNYLKEERGIIHRDVKPSNMLLDWNGTIKLCDFGISGKLIESKAQTRNAGCAAYMSPERIEPDPLKPLYDIRADVWSLGISLVELATGRFPYADCHTDFEILTKVLQEDPPRLDEAHGFSSEFCHFVSECLTKDYRTRPKYPQLLATPFLSRYNNAPAVDVAKWFADVMTPTDERQTSISDIISGSMPHTNSTGW